jgi:hypothetical protein
MTPRTSKRASVEPGQHGVPEREPAPVTPVLGQAGTSRSQAANGRLRDASAVPGESGLLSPADAGDRAEAQPAPAGGTTETCGVLPAGSSKIAAAMSEAKLEEHIRELCKDLGIVRIHVYYSRGTTPGVPDDILIGPRGILWRELKTMKGKVSPAQQAMGEALLAAGQDWGVWRPDSLLSGEIAYQLAAISALRVGAA